ncbi:DUF1707 SHOCT-like domain-containing protein [Sphaerisporangium dianthi]|uniref:DUF1707 domain-containing protein n=1 Tax=Sphaerisporangium dianthi TaxID=1436120 RepID=A0ABV9CDE5_9ACTN
MTDAIGNLRASDADREAVSERLRIAAGEGRITLDELDERLERTYAAKTYAELDALIDDLPRMPVGTALAASSDEPLVLRTGAGSITQAGQWTVPRRIVGECTWGNLKIDFTGATCPHREVQLNLTCGAGTITVIVPRGWAVVIDDITSGMGNMVNKVTSPPEPDRPVLRVNGRVGMGTIKLKHPRR